jgi:hypothetical protein
MSKKKLLLIIVGCIIVLAAIAMPLGPKIVTDYSSFLDYLRASGVSISEERQTSWNLFYNAVWRIVEVDGIHIQVYEFATMKDMEADASCVSPDGFEITKDRGDGRMTHKCIGWIDTPHFYKAGRIIVAYIGNNCSMISLLENAFGKQFAGM